MKKYLLYALIAILSFASCSEEESVEKVYEFDANQPLTTTVQGWTFDMSTFELDFSNFWKVYIDDYGWELIGSCECDEGVEYIPELFGNHGHLFGDYFVCSSVNPNYMCSEYIDFFKPDCVLNEGQCFEFIR